MFSSSSRLSSCLIQRAGFCRKSRGLMRSKGRPRMEAKVARIRPMSWCSGSQLTMRTGGCSFTAMKICSTLVTMDLWVDHARRGAGGAGGVLQERLVGALRRQLRMLGQQPGRVLPLLSEAVRQGVGDEHA